MKAIPLIIILAFCHILSAEEYVQSFESAVFSVNNNTIYEVAAKAELPDGGNAELEVSIVTIEENAGSIGKIKKLGIFNPSCANFTGEVDFVGTNAQECKIRICPANGANYSFKVTEASLKISVRKTEENGLANATGENNSNLQSESISGVAIAFIDGINICADSEKMLAGNTEVRNSAQTKTLDAKRIIYLNADLGLDTNSGRYAFASTSAGPKRSIKGALNTASEGDAALYEIVLEESPRRSYSAGEIKPPSGKTIIIKANGIAVIRGEEIK